VGGGVVSTIPVMFLAFAFANVGGGVGAGLWIYTSMELLVFAVAFFPLLILAKRAIASTEVKQHVPLKRAFDEDRVVVQVTASGKVERRIRRRVLSLPGSRPVAWRECTNALVGTKKRTLRLTALVSGGVGAFLAHIVLVVIADGGGEVGGFAFVTACLWIAAVFVISLHVANLISKERANGTLVTLMATPLTARDILAQKLAAAWRLCLVLGAPMLLTALVAAVVVPIGDEPYRVNIGYLLVSCLTSVVYLYGLVWIPFSACLRQRRRAHVVVTALSRVMLVLFAPLLVSLLTVGMNEHGVAEFFSMMSPMVFAAMVQFGDSPVYERLWIIPVNLGFYLGLALLLRAYVYARGPALLKRVGR